MQGRGERIENIKTKHMYEYVIQMQMHVNGIIA